MYNCIIYNVIHQFILTIFPTGHLDVYCTFYCTCIFDLVFSNDKNDQPGPSGEGNKDTQNDKATGGGGEGSSSGGDNSDPVDPFVALMNEETKRLQSENTSTCTDNTYHVQKHVMYIQYVYIV